MRYGSLDEARRSFVRARGFAASRGSGLERASCERLLGDVACLRGNAHEAHTAYVRAERDLAGSAVRGSEEARLRLSQGRLAWRAGRLRQAEILLGQASESAQRCGDLLLLGHVRLEQAWCGLFSGDWADAWAQAQEASEAAHRRGHGWGELEAETVAALARWLSGEAAEPLLRSDLPGSPHPEPGDQRDVLQTLAVGLPATGGLLAHGTRSGQELWPSPAPAVDGPWLEVLDRHLDEGAEVRDADLDVARTAEDALLLGRLRARRLGFSEDRAEAPPLRAVLAVLDTLREITPALLAGSLVGRRIPLVLGEVPVDLDDRALLRGLFPEQIRLLPGQGRALAPAPVLRAVAATAPFGGWPAFGPLFQELARWDRLVAEELPDTRGGPDGGLAHGVRRGLLVDLLLSRGRGSSGHDGWTTVCRSLAPAVTAEALRRAFWLSTASTELGRIAEALPPRPSGSVARLRNWYGLPSEQGAQVEELVQRSAGVREELGDLPAEVEAGGLLGAHILRARLLPSNWVEGLRTPPFDVASVRRALAVWPLAEVPAADPTGALVLLLRLGELLCPTPGRRVGLARPADSEAGAALEVIVDGPTPPAAAHKATAALAVWPGGLPRLTIVGADPDGQRAVLALGLEEHSRVHQSPGTLAAAFQGAPASERPRLLSAFVEALTDADPKELADSVLALGDLDPDDAGSVLDGLLATGESVPAMAELVCFLDAKKTEIAGRAVLDSLSADRPHPEVVAAYRRIHGYLDETQQTRGARQILRLLRRSPDVPTIEAAAMATLGVDIACGDDTRAAFIAALQRRQSDGRLDTQVLAKALGRLERTRDVRGRS